MTTMTKCTLILSLFPMLFSCSPSRKEKAAEIAKSEMIKILYNAGSYEPIETQIDSAFTSIYTDLDIVRAAHELIELNAGENKEWLQQQYNFAKSSAALWSQLQDAYSKEQYRQAREEMSNYASKLKEIEEEINTKTKTIRERADAIVENQFYGWNIYHRFRCANGYGIKKISDILFVVDEDMKIVKGCFSLDKDDDYNLVKLKKTIDKAIEKPEIK